LAASAREPAGARPLGNPQGTVRAILSERRFSGSDVPRPFHRPLSWLGGELRRAYDWVSRWLPGGRLSFWTLAAAAIVLLAATAAVRMGRRRSALLVEGGGARVRGRSEDPRELERAADEAERGGDLERALRLRFRAGLLRLE